MPTQPIIHPKLTLTAAPTRVVPCATLATSLRVGTAPREATIIPPDNKSTGPALIKQEEE